MIQYTLRRLFLGGLTALLVSVIVFVILRIAPGDVVDVILGGEDAFYSQETEELLREQLGLNRPLHIQYLVFMRDFVTLNWGTSLVTLQLAIMTVTIAVVFGIPVGIMMALKQDSWMDYLLRIVSLGGLSIPSFWTGTMIILGGTLYFNWSPRLEYVSFLADPRGNLIMFLWPAMALGWVSQATKARMMRSTMLEVLRQDYIRTAHAKGLRYFVVVYRHAMKNALLPVVTIIGITVALTVGGSVIMESIFLLPGMGSFLIYSLSRWDYPVVQTLVLFFASWIVVTNLLVDLSYGWLDPRVRFD
ncbi:MAG: ABC transporter permease [Dehalococcoidia bacterium]|jgi:peptide/nickel transport system permease protein|nr:ABC transporter permease [Dehalococcoidia bacterium]